MNTDSDFEIARQGSLDGLCGLYSVVNYFSRRSNLDGEALEKFSKSVLKRGLGAIESSEQLTSHNLIAGYWDGQLRKAADAIKERYAPHVQVIKLPSFAKSQSIEDPRELIRALKGKGAAVLNMNEPRGHWVLAFSTSSGALRYDDPATGETKRFGSAAIAERCIDMGKGLVFIHA